MGLPGRANPDIIMQRLNLSITYARYAVLVWRPYFVLITRTFDRHNWVNAGGVDGTDGGPVQSR